MEAVEEAAEERAAAERAAAARVAAARAAAEEEEAAKVRVRAKVVGTTEVEGSLRVLSRKKEAAVRREEEEEEEAGVAVAVGTRLLRSVVS